jgi:serine/threonine protein phosphatase PrpC
MEEIKNKRASVIYQAKETPDRGSPMIRRSSAPFDKAHIGTKTRHGIMPGPRGLANAKINQDRGVVCWPFHGSLNEALLCVFDGHGSKGEKASEFCMHHIPAFLENDEGRLSLRSDPIEALRRACVKADESLFASELGKTAMTCGTTSTVLYLNGADCWTACAGDSRAVLGRRVGGQIIAMVRRSLMASVI